MTHEDNQVHVSTNEQQRCQPFLFSRPIVEGDLAHLQHNAATHTVTHICMHAHTYTYAKYNTSPHAHMCITPTALFFYRLFLVLLDEEQARLLFSNVILCDVV